MSNHGYSTRPLVPIPVSSSNEDDPSEMMYQGYVSTRALRLSAVLFNCKQLASESSGDYNPPVNCSIPATAPLNSWQAPQNPPNGMLPYPFAPIPPVSITAESRCFVPGPILDEWKNRYGYGEDEEVIKYPRMDSSSHPPRPIYTHHTLNPHSPKPRAAAGTQMMFQNIIGYTEPVPSPGSAAYPTNQTGIPGVTGNVNTASGSGISSGRTDAKVRRSSKSKKLCGNCKNPACKYPDAYICAMVEIEASGAESRELYGELRGILGEMCAQRKSKATK